MQKDIITRANKFVSFIRTRHPHSLQIPHELLDLISFVADDDFATADPHSSTEHQRYLDNLYPVEWAESQNTFQSALQAFLTDLEGTFTTPPTHQSLQQPDSEELHRQQLLDDKVNTISEVYYPQLPVSHTPSPQQQTRDSSNSNQRSSASNLDTSNMSDRSSPQPQSLGPEMRAEITSLIAAALQEFRNELPQRAASPPSRSSQGPRLQTLSPDAPNENTSRLRADDIGYFNPDIANKDIMESTSSKIVYNDVYPFTDRLLHMSKTYGDQKSQAYPRTQQKDWINYPRNHQQNQQQRHQHYTGGKGPTHQQYAALPSNPPSRLQITAQNGFASNRPWKNHFQPSDPAAAFAEEPEDTHQDMDIFDEPDTDTYLEEHQDTQDEIFDHEPVAQFSQPTLVGIKCRFCNATFSSNNKLHLHLRNTGCRKSSVVHETSVHHNDNTPIIKSTSQASLDCGTGYGFRKWHYVTAMVKLHMDMDDTPVCIDTGCSLSLMDKAWLAEHFPSIKIRKMAAPIMVRGISDLKHPTSEYVILTFYIHGHNAYASITREIHLVDNLQAKMLIGVDILGPEEIDISISKQSATIGACEGMEIPIQIVQRGKRVRRSVLAQQALTLPSHSRVTIPVHHIALPDRNFIFEPSSTTLTMYAYLVDQNMSGIVAQNNTDVAVQVQRNLKVGTIEEFDFDTHLVCLYGDADYQELNLLAQKSPTYVSTSFKVSGDKDNKRVLPSGVTIYGDNKRAMLYQQMLNEFPDLFKNEQCELIKPSAKIYAVGTENKKIIDEAYDKLYLQGRMEYTTHNTPLTFPVFVVYRTLPSGKRVGRAVADIRDLNSIVVPDTYPLPLQSDIIAICRGCNYISAIDATSFFYQWRIHPESQKYLSVVTHRGQETFKVAIMGFRNSPAYCQRKMDSFMRDIAFSRAYINNVIVTSKTLAEHIDHLKTVLRIFQLRHITVKPEKIYLGFPSAVVLGQKVTALGLSTTAERLEAISRITFPTTLKNLETYLGITGYLRQFVKNYAIISKPLEDRKTALLKAAPAKGRPRQNFSLKTSLQNPTSAELNSFRTIQKILASETNLVHYDPNRQLFADIDASKDGIGIMVYHVKRNSPLSLSYLNPNAVSKASALSESQTTPILQHNASDEELVPHQLTPAAQTSDKPNDKAMRSTYPRKADTEPIMFLSRKLNDAKTRYWPTEMEMTAVIWTARKIKHLIETTQKPPVIFYVDHGPLLGAAQHSSIVKTNSVAKLNLKLVRASEFLSTMPIEIFYKPGKSYVVPDALSRLPSTNVPSPDLDASEELDTLNHCAPSSAYHYTAALIAMSPELKQKIAAGYAADPKWSKILEILQAEQKRANPSTLPFELHDQLIFRISPDGIPRRLCVPPNAITEILTEAHNQNSHPGYAKLWDLISRSFFIRGISQHLRQFLKHCPQCNIFQTKRHAPFGSLQPIITPPVPYHTITINFILALPTTQQYDSALTVTCKFSKKVALVAGHSEWKASQWAASLVHRLIDLDWGLPKVIISDRGPQFLSQLWQGLFASLGTKLLFSTAYHPQIDGQSEQTNQTVELALRFLFHTLNDITAWPEHISLLQHYFNNSLSASTGRSPNEIVTGFTPNDVIHLLMPDSPLSQTLHSTYRIDIADSIANASIMMKYYYDRKHTPIALKTGDMVYIKLYKGYSIPAATSKKLHQQRVEPFEITEQVSPLAFRLHLPDHWRVHPVFSVAQLEPAPNDSDPYDRPRPEHPGSIFVEGDNKNKKSFEVEKLIAKRVTPTGRVRYLNASDLVKKYEEKMNKSF
ncbi:hypothetical protein B7494_g5085 [Chlorociboria aeruginascens]|nr:hypothetical protein B7494_g5085 [Chlorociboria aeruginascens]